MINDIRQLPPSVVNKIAAGEVIERPASVVKELMENSIDAGATRIDVAVEQGGLELVRVGDDGCGIAAEQLPLAVASHATSKISRRRRSVPRPHAGLSRRSAGLDRRSQPPGAPQPHAGQRRGLRSSKSPAASRTAGGALRLPGGHDRSKFDNLFYNTPVRRKFLRSTQTEMGHVSEAFTRLALAHPHVHFTLKHNGRVVLRPAASGRLARADRGLLRRTTWPPT